MVGLGLETGGSIVVELKRMLPAPYDILLCRLVGKSLNEYLRLKRIKGIGLE